jgi:Ca2+-binding RTX toxin-like protein
MAIDIPSDDTQFLIDQNDQTYILQAAATRSATGTDPAILMASAAHGDTLILNGHAEQTDNAISVIQVDGTDMQVSLTESGSILGIGGVELDGANAILLNAGSIEATGMNSYAIYSTSANATITNTGTIKDVHGGSAILTGGEDSNVNNNGTLQGNYGILVNDARTTIQLGANSTIIGSEVGISASNTEATDRVSVTNHGDIQGTNFAIQFTEGSNDTVVNQGTMTGAIFLGSGQDVFDNRGGTVDHAIQGFLGDDTLITDDSTVTLAENANQGYDTVKSTVHYALSDNVERLMLIGTKNANGSGNDGNNDLFGNIGKNQLSGEDGTDTLDGGKGDDRLTGGTGKDTFVFKTGYGHDTIADFSHADRDKVDLRDWGSIDNFHDVKQHWAMDHGNLVITSGNNQLILENTTRSDVHASDFLFTF